MPKLLHIIASPREDKSRTLQISAAFLKSFQEKHPQYTIDTLNLAQEQLPALTMKRVDGKYELLQGQELFGDMKDSWEAILTHIDRFLSADLYLISTPMWNFSIPYTLKQYIDIIAQPKYLFRYTPQGVEGLAKNKKMIAICTSGGSYTSPETKAMDFQKPYLQAIFGFVGIKDITFITGAPMDAGKEKQEQQLKEAIAAALALGKQI